MQVNLFGESGQRRNFESQGQGGKKKKKTVELKGFDVEKKCFDALRSEWGKTKRHDSGMTS